MKEIYHITDKRNLAAILRDKGLYSKNQLKNDYVNIAYEKIQDRRAKKKVPIHPGGNLHDYIPFYFAPLSPMLYAIHQGAVEGYSGGQKDIIYFVSEKWVNDKNIAFVFTDGHAIMELSTFFNDQKNLDKIDWEIMEYRYWDNTYKDPDRMRRRQAEFLVKKFFPFQLVQEIGVIDKDVQREIISIASPFGYDKIVNIRKEWYY